MQRTILTVAITAAAVFAVTVMVFGLSLINVPALSFFQSQPSPTPVIVSSAGIVKEIQSLQRLETTRYTIETVVQAKAGEDSWFNKNERLLLIAHGNVVAGVDLGKLTAKDVTVAPDGEAIEIMLPAVEFLSTTLDEEKTSVYSREEGKVAGFFGKEANKDLESKARRDGLKQIVASACEDAVVQRATDDSKQAMENIMSLAGFEKVTITVQEPEKPICRTPMASSDN